MPPYRTPGRASRGLEAREERGVVARGRRRRGGGERRLRARACRRRRGHDVGARAGTTGASETRKRPRVSVAADAGAEVAACAATVRCLGQGRRERRLPISPGPTKCAASTAAVGGARRVLQQGEGNTSWRRRSMRPRARAWSGVTSTCFASRMDSASSCSSVARPSTNRAGLGERVAGGRRRATRQGPEVVRLQGARRAPRARRRSTLQRRARSCAAAASTAKRTASTGTRRPRSSPVIR